MEERDELYIKWDVPLEGKHRKMQLVNKLWTDPHDAKHIEESAKIVAKLVGFREGGNLSREMFELNFALPSDKRQWLVGWNQISNLIHLWKNYILFVSNFPFLSFVHATEFWSFPPKCLNYFLTCDWLIALCLMMARDINFCNIHIWIKESIHLASIWFELLDIIKVCCWERKCHYLIPLVQLMWGGSRKKRKIGT